jgi:hypothetical protein
MLCAITHLVSDISMPSSIQVIGSAHKAVMSDLQSVNVECPQLHHLYLPLYRIANR